MAKGIGGQFPWNFQTNRPDLALRYGDTWECALEGCEFSLTHTTEEAIGSAFMVHAATRHPKATAEATGKNPEELAARFGGN